MGFVLTELVLETIIRDGLRDIANSLGTVNDKIDEIFDWMKEPHLNEYFGNQAINTIKEFIRDYKKINIAQTYPLQDSKMPMISIFLMPNRENEALSAIDDFIEDQDTTITPEIVVNSFSIDSYNPTTGMVDVTTSDIDLSGIRAGHYLFDSNNNSYQIIGGIKNVAGSKHFFIETGSLDTDSAGLSGYTIKNSIVIQRKEIRGIRDSETIGIGILTENQLMTKYLYNIIKYIICAYKLEMINRRLEITTFDGSDLLRPDFLPNVVFARFLNLQIRMIEHTWVASEPTITDGFDGSAIYVARDEYERDDESDFTVQTIIDSDE